MVKELSAVDIYYFLKELKQLENSKVDKIYHTTEKPDELLIVVHVTGKGKHIIRIILPSLIFIDYKKEEQGTATGLCMMLRKNLEGKIINKILQLKFERIIKIIFNNNKSLIIELFDKGNIIFCDENEIILNCLTEKKWKDREIKKKQKYQEPISKNILEITEEEISEILKNTKKENLVKTLAIDFGLGGIYAEELCSIMGIDKNSKNADAKKISKGLKELLNKELKPNSFQKKIFPIELKTIKPEKYYETFNQAILENIEVTDSENKKIEEKKSKIKKIIYEQTKLQKQIEEEINDNQKKGEAIYENYRELEEIIKIIKEAKKKYSTKEIKERIKKDEKFSKIIKDIDEQTVTINIDELRK